MMLVKDSYIIVDRTDGNNIWKKSIFTKEEAEKEIIEAKAEKHFYELIELSEHFDDLYYAWY